ncbi:MAG: HepT-like ribonuclease domain-containing protein [Prosthecobacter sp.]|nr:HepT-like ribonuclease domain-containing protein [Prosthecobacter sp.]
MDEKQTGLLQDILDSARQIRHYLSGVTKEDFGANLEKQDAVLRRFEIIGEAASRLSADVQSLFPGLPFRNMRGMRNIIAHDYGDVDILIETLQKHFANTGSG